MVAVEEDAVSVAPEPVPLPSASSTCSNGHKVPIHVVTFTITASTDIIERRVLTCVVNMACKRNARSCRGPSVGVSPSQSDHASQSSRACAQPIA